MIPTHGNTMTDAALCHANGWTVGTELANAAGTQHVQITAIGEFLVLAMDQRNLTRGVRPRHCEGVLSLDGDNWHAISPAPPAPESVVEVEMDEELSDDDPANPDQETAL